MEVLKIKKVNFVKIVDVNGKQMISVKFSVNESENVYSVLLFENQVKDFVNDVIEGGIKIKPETKLTERTFKTKNGQEGKETVITYLY